MSDALAMLGKVVGTPSIGSAGSAAPAAGISGGEDFSKMISSMTSEAIATIQKGEAVSMAGMQGQASVQQVVEAVMQAERSLQTMVAVRDKVISAYLEISRMQI